MSHPDQQRELLDRQDSHIDPMILCEPYAPRSEARSASDPQQPLSEQTTRQGDGISDYATTQFISPIAPARQGFQAARPQYSRRPGMAWQNHTPTSIYQTLYQHTPSYRYQHVAQSYQEQNLQPIPYAQKSSHIPQDMTYAQSSVSQAAIQSTPSVYDQYHTTNFSPFYQPSLQANLSESAEGRLYDESNTACIPTSYNYQPQLMQICPSASTDPRSDNFRPRASAHGGSPAQSPMRFAPGEAKTPTFSPITPDTSPLRYQYLDTRLSPVLLGQRTQRMGQRHVPCADPIPSIAVHKQLSERSQHKSNANLIHSQPCGIQPSKAIEQHSPAVIARKVIKHKRAPQSLRKANKGLAQSVTTMLAVDLPLRTSVTSTKDVIFCCRQFPLRCVGDVAPHPGKHRTFAIRQFLAWAATSRATNIPAMAEGTRGGRRPVKWAPFVIQVSKGDQPKNYYIPQPLPIYHIETFSNCQTDEVTITFQPTESAEIKTEFLGCFHEATWKLHCADAACCTHHERPPEFTVKLLSAAYSLEAEDIPDHIRRGAVGRMRQRLGHVHKVQEVLLALDVMDGDEAAAVDFVRNMNT